MKTYQQESVSAGKESSTSNVSRTTKTTLQAPARALHRLAAQEATSSDILTLQRSIGNQATTHLVQRHPDDIMDEYSFWTTQRETGAEVWLWAPATTSLNRPEEPREITE